MALNVPIYFIAHGADPVSDFLNGTQPLKGTEQMQIIPGTGFSSGTYDVGIINWIWKEVDIQTDGKIKPAN